MFQFFLPVVTYYPPLTIALLKITSTQPFHAMSGNITTASDGTMTYFNINVASAAGFGGGVTAAFTASAL